MDPGEDQPPPTLAEIEQRLIAQEHRLLPILSNVVRTWRLPRSDGRRRAAVVAVLYRLLGPATVATVGVGAVGVLTLLVAMRANALLELQNERLKVQNELMESERRRAAFSEEVVATLAELAASADRGTDPLAAPGARAQLVALTHSLRPYRSLDVETPFDDPKDRRWTLFGLFAPIAENRQQLGRALSPERGRILRFLLGLPLRVLEHGESRFFPAISLDNFNFDYADMRGTRLANVYVMKASLRGADFSASNLEKTYFVASRLEDARFDGATFRESGFESASISRVSFAGADLTNALLEKTLLSRESDFRDAKLDGLRFVKLYEGPLPFVPPGWEVQRVGTPERPEYVIPPKKRK